jgi:MinD superfamily P-loop ATPase
MKAKQLVVVSGKGGTGKTTLVAALAALALEPVLADCDVDAPDLHLLLAPEVETREVFHGLKLARIDPDTCTSCGLCVESCRFRAISEDIVVDQAACEGCDVCAIVCPAGAATLTERVSGEVFTSGTRFGPMAHAKLMAGEEASGKLVSQVRTAAEALAEETGRDLLLIDGPPGIGCPVIASMSGVDAALVVAEPTLSGRQGMRRAVEVAQHFGVPVYAVVNRADLRPEEAEAIESWCRQRGVEVLGRLPYDTSATDAMIARRTVVEHGSGPLAGAISELWERLAEVLGLKEGWE